MSGNSHTSTFIEITFAYWCSKETEKQYESGCNMKAKFGFWGISLKKILEPNYLYSYQHKTLSFKKTCGIYCNNKNYFVSFLIYQIKVWKTLFYYYILFMFKVIMRLVIIKALL